MHEWVFPCHISVYRYMILAASMNRDALSDLEDSVSRLKQGDLGALNEVMTRYQHRMYRFLIRLTQDPGVAEDLFQQTWIRVIEKIGRYDARRQFEPWLFSVARNLTIDYLRQRRPESLDVVDEFGAAPVDRLSAPDQDPLEQLLEYERGGVLAAAVATLPLIHREVLTLRFEEELKLDEIAEIAGIPVSTVKSRLLRALSNLRERLASQ
jgi:RNA polymerase sigma-70 factor (ECF subfamily)